MAKFKQRLNVLITLQRGKMMLLMPGNEENMHIIVHIHWRQWIEYISIKIIND